MEFIGSLNAFLIFTGLCFEVAAAWLLFSPGRVTSIGALARATQVLLLIAILFQILGLLVPEGPITSYWFILGALPLLLPAALVYSTQSAKLGYSPPSVRAIPPKESLDSKLTPASQTEYQQFIKRVPQVLAAHPQGLTLVEIGKELGIEWRRLTGATNELLKLGRIRKEGKRYFIRSEKRG